MLPHSIKLLWKPLVASLAASLLICISLMSYAGTSQWLELDVYGKQRKALVYKPDTIGNKKLPVVLAYHGFGETPGAMMDKTDFNALADKEQFIAVYPLGLSRVWNGGAEYGNRDPQDIQFFDALLDELAASYPLDPERVYATGFSNGGFFAARLACERPDKVAAIALVAATIGTPLQQRCETAPPVPVFMINGTSDPVVRWDGTIGRVGLFFRDSIITGVPAARRFWLEHTFNESKAKILRFLQKPPINGSYIVETDYGPSDSKAMTPVLFWTVHQGGHTWPSTTVEHPVLNTLLRPVVGRQNHDKSASEAIWQFFSQFPLKNN